MKHILKSLLLASIIAIIPSVVFAHVLKSDGDIGAIIHIDPEDSPIVGEPATFFFEFKDKSGKLNLAQCDCMVTIANRGTQVLSQPLSSSSSSLNSPAFQYTFPEKSLYTVVVKGSPQLGASFQAFTLSYDIRVDRGGDIETPAEKKSSHTTHYIIFGGGFVALLILYLVERNKKKKIKHTSGSKMLHSLFAIIALSGLLFHHGMALVDACHEDGDLQAQHKMACCSVPDGAVLDSESVTHQMVSYEIVLDTFFDSSFVISKRAHNKSPPVELYS